METRRETEQWRRLTANSLRHGTWILVTQFDLPRPKSLVLDVARLSVSLQHNYFMASYFISNDKVVCYNLKTAVAGETDVNRYLLRQIRVK